MNAEVFWFQRSGSVYILSGGKSVPSCKLERNTELQHGGRRSVKRRKRITQWQAESRLLGSAAMNCADMDFSLSAAPSDEKHHELHSTGGNNNPSVEGGEALLPLEKEYHYYCYPTSYERRSIHWYHCWTEDQKTHQKVSHTSTPSNGY